MRRAVPALLVMVVLTGWAALFVAGHYVSAILVAAAGGIGWSAVRAFDGRAHGGSVSKGPTGPAASNKPRRSG